MERTVIEYIQMCDWGTAKFLIFSNNVFGNLVYYSHLLPLIISLLLALFIFFKNKKLLSTRWFAITIILLSIWLFSDLVLWANEKPSLIMFFWSLLVLIEPMIYAGTLFFTYALIDGKDISFRKKLIIFGLLLPTVILTSTRFALTEYDLTNCNREAIEGNLAFYGYAIEILFSLWILGFGIKRFIQFKDRAEKIKVALITSGAVFFLLSFAMGNVVGSLIRNWEIGQYGLFGIPVFMAMLAYLIVKYHLFNTKLIATQLLITALWILTFAILFLRRIESVQIVVVITLFFFTILGYLLIRSVKREIQLRESLQIANEGQSNLIHIMNHQIKGYLSKSRNIFAELLSENGYGINDESRPMIKEGFESLTEGVGFVQQVLNGSSAETGTLIYAKNRFDMKELVEDTIQGQKDSALKAGLAYESKIDDGNYNMIGDNVQIKESVRNLIDNSIRYTQSGGLKIHLSRNDDKILFSVEDTGVGIAPEDRAKLFTKGGRGKDSLKYNVNSTGYGLAFVKAVVEAHKGRVWVDSKGANQGSTFYMELPVVI